MSELMAINIFPGIPKKLDVSAAVTAKTNKISNTKSKISCYKDLVTN